MNGGSDRTRVIAGAMSGTSADGVDVAITRVDGRGHDMRPQLLHHHHRPYPRQLREQLFAIRASGSAALGPLAELARTISLVYAAAVNEALMASGISSKELSAVAAHGQTLFHEPPNTLQWLDPALLSAEVGAAVVSDFRRADCAAGGQGAPLVPFADYILFRHPTKHRVVVNIGGIANATLLLAGTAVDKVIAFDTGPGNCISDWLCRTHDPSGPGYDAGGQRALRGQASRPLAEAFQANDYFARRAPKSTDGPQMIALFADAMKAAGPLSLEDLLATAVECTCGPIVFATGLSYIGESQFGGEVIVSGGGVHNAAIMRCLRFWLPSQLKTTDEMGIKGEAREAMAFALLGAATLDGIPANIPSVTGAKRPVVLGCITPAP